MKRRRNGKNLSVSVNGPQGDNARDVEAPEVQGHLLASNSVRADIDAAIGIRHVLGLRRLAPQPLKCLLTPPSIFLPRHGRHLDAHPPGKVFSVEFILD